MLFRSFLSSSRIFCRYCPPASVHRACRAELFFLLLLLLSRLHFLFCRSQYGTGGFNHLLQDGLVFSNVDFGFDGVDEASAIAGIYTGTYPNRHSITGSTVFDREKNKSVSILEDKNFLGNYTSEHLSPLKLTSGTIGDELRSLDRKSVV